MNRLLGSVLLAGVACCAVVSAQELPNPFARPASTSARAGAEPAEAPLSLALRATLVRGRASSANIGGTIVRIGQTIGGYRLASVHEGTVMLVDAAGVTHVLEIEPPQQVAAP